MTILQARSHRRCEAHMIRRQCSVTFRHWRLANVVTSEVGHALRGGKGSECLVSTYLPCWSDGFDSRGATHVRVGGSNCWSSVLLPSLPRAFRRSSVQGFVQEWASVLLLHRDKAICVRQVAGGATAALLSLHFGGLAASRLRRRFPRYPFRH